MFIDKHNIIINMLISCQAYHGLSAVAVSKDVIIFTYGLSEENFDLSFILLY